MAIAMTCAQESRVSSETLAGTFKPADTFFLIESRLSEYGGWQGEIVKQTQKSGAYAPIMQHLGKVPRAKLLFIRRPASDGKNFYIALANQAQPKIYHCALSEYEDLLSLSIDSISAGNVPKINGQAMQEIPELYAICTNGKHDPCCATHGVPVYHALVEVAGADLVWQTTHIGGHRMAATMIAFPQGISYGHLDPLDAEAVIANHRAGYLLTHKLRGRGAYSGHSLGIDAHAAASAAEVHIREAEGLYALQDLQLQDTLQLDGGRHLVTFVAAEGGRHQVEVQTDLSAPRQTSCGDAAKPMPQHEIKAHLAPV